MSSEFANLRHTKELVGPYVRSRLAEFKRLGAEGITTFDFRPFADYVYEADLFSELCFCILTANSSAITAIRIQKEAGGEFLQRSGRKKLENLIASIGHRFVRQRVERILKARKKFQKVMELLQREKDPMEIRELISNSKSQYKIEGFGLKEASHFLRNVGHENLAIVDRHILRFLRDGGFIQEQKTLTRKVYMQAEEALQKICNNLGLTQAELDLYIFYQKTGKVLK